MKKILLIDNYDSFTYNLKQLLENNSVQVLVQRNDEIQFDALQNYDGIVLSPGPSVPDNAGDLKKLIRLKTNLPILGICLGMQAIAEVYGSELALMEKPLHGISTKINHYGDPIFANIQNEMEVASYHSWFVKSSRSNPNLEIIANDENNVAMALKICGKPVFGFQFHPESIMTPDGNQMIINFLNYCNA